LDSIPFYCLKFLAQTIIIIIILTVCGKEKKEKKRLFSSVIKTQVMENIIFIDAFISGMTDEYSMINENNFY